MKIDAFKRIKKSTHRTTFVRKFVTQNFQKSPNLVTLISAKMKKVYHYEF